MMQSGGEKAMGCLEGLRKSSSRRRGSDDEVGKPVPGFRMPLHYPRYNRADYGKMEEWKLDMLLGEYGLSFEGTIEEKRAYAIGAFLWPDQA